MADNLLRTKLVVYCKDRADDFPSSDGAAKPETIRLILSIVINMLVGVTVPAQSDRRIGFGQIAELKSWLGKAFLNQVRSRPYAVKRNEAPETRTLA